MEEFEDTVIIRLVDFGGIRAIPKAQILVILASTFYILHLE
jgi:hypothetical protein